MKTNIYSLCLLIISILFFSCEDENDTAYESANFHGVISQFEGDESATTWAENDQVGVYMVSEGEPLSAETIVNGVDNKKFVYDINGNIILEGEDLYYPSDGSHVDLYAYYPYNSSVVNGIYPVDVSQQDDFAKIDLMRAAIKNKSQLDAYINIKFGFKHELAKINVTIEKSTDIADMDLSSIQLIAEGMPTTADFNVETEVYSNRDNVAPFEMKANEAGTGYEALVIPTLVNTFSDKVIRVSAPEELDLEAASFEIPDNLAIEAGKSYSFTIILTKTGSSIISYSVGDYYPDPDVDLNDPEAKAEIQGVVFWVDPISEGTKGLVMNLEDVNSSGFASGSYGARWGKDNVYEMDLVSSITDEDDGYTATKALIAAHKDEADFSTNYVLFDYIYSSLNNGDENGVWYMPSYNELRKLMAYSFGIDYDDVLADWEDAILNSSGLDVIPTIELDGKYPTGVSLEARTLLNQILTAAGGSKIPDDRQHASTFEIDATHFKAVNSLNGRIHSRTKNGCQLRAIRSF